MLLMALLATTSACFANTEVVGTTAEMSSFESFAWLLVGGFQQLFYGITNLGWLSIIVVLLLLGVSSAIIYGIRRFDKSYQKPWLYYILYFVALIPTFGMFLMALIGKATMTRYECVLSFLMLMVFAVLSIFGGWGIRECGMIDEKYHKNANRLIGQLLQFPVWMMVIIIFWIAALDPIVDWSATFVDQGGGFWRFVLGIILGSAIVIGILMAWVMLVVPYALKTAGKWPIRIMMVVLWAAMLTVGFNWAYANFNNISFVLFLFIGGVCFFVCLGTAWSQLQLMRCTMCHNCHSQEINRIDKGYSEGTSTYWTNADQSEVGKYKKHFGSEIKEARKLVKTTTLYHNWNAIQQCPNCGKKWTIKYSDEVASHSEDIEYKWKERC